MFQGIEIGFQQNYYLINLRVCSFLRARPRARRPTGARGSRPLEKCAETWHRGAALSGKLRLFGSMSEGTIQICLGEVVLDGWRTGDRCPPKWVGESWYPPPDQLGHAMGRCMTSCQQDDEHDRNERCASDDVRKLAWPEAGRTSEDDVTSTLPLSLIIKHTTNTRKKCRRPQCAEGGCQCLIPQMEVVMSLIKILRTPFSRHVCGRCK